MFEDIRNYILIVMLRNSNANWGKKKTPTNNTKTKTIPPSRKKKVRTNNTVRVDYL